MRVLFLDCSSGISGDMTVGALCDLGVKPSALEWELSKLDIGDFHMHFERQHRKSVEGIHFSIHAGAVHTHSQDAVAPAHPDSSATAHEQSHAGCCHDHDHDHDHDHGHAHGHAHGRSYLDIKNIIEHSELTPFVKKHAVSIFERIANAEGKIHGTPPESVEFHEVGALDSIADIVCACVGLESLGVEKVYASRLQEGHGTVRCAHGILPVPTPATLEILKGIPLLQIDEPHELITPTGAAIVAEFAESFGLMPGIKVESIGYGLGSRDLASRPNVLRAVLGEMI